MAGVLDDLEGTFVSLEAARTDGNARVIGMLCGVLLEGLLKKRVFERLGGPAEGRAGVLARLDEVPGEVSEMGVGALLRVLKGDKLLRTEHRGTELWRLTGVRNWAVHDKWVPPPELEQCQRLAELTWDLARELGLVREGFRVRARFEGRRHPDIAPSGRRAPQFDRAAHKGQITSALEATEPVVLVLHGEPDQGHEAMAAFALAKMRGGRTQVDDLQCLAWPSPLLPVEQRHRIPREYVARRLATTAEVEGALAQAVSDRLRSLRIFLRITVPTPTSADGQELADFLAELLPQPAGLVVVVELHQSRPGGFFDFAVRRAAREARLGCDRIRRALEELEGAHVVVLPKLQSLTVRDISHGLHQDEQPPEEAERTARRLHEHSGGGRYADLCRLLKGAH